MAGAERSFAFRTTRWSVVFAAGGSTTSSREALEELCATYWRPINGFIRRRGHDAEAARDLTQGFFAGFLQQRAVEDLDPSRGRFRSYLLACVKHFLANEKEREGAQKRGGGTQLFSLSNDSASDLVFEPADPRTPEAIYEHTWALALLRRALERLRPEQEACHRLQLFERLKPTLAGESIDGGYAAVAEELALATVAVKVAAHRHSRGPIPPELPPAPSVHAGVLVRPVEHHLRSFVARNLVWPRRTPIAQALPR